MRVVKRNLYRLPHLLDRLPPLAAPGSPRGEPAESAPRGKAEEPPERVECCVCGFGAMAPPVGFVLAAAPAERAEERLVFRGARPRGRPPSEGSTHRVLLRMRSTCGALASDVELFAKRLARSREEEKIPFLPNGRGAFWRCVGCGCVVHEQCLDFKDHWMLYADGQFRCAAFGGLRCRLPLSALPLRGSADQLVALREFLLALRPAGDAGLGARRAGGSLLLRLRAQRRLSDDGLQPRLCAQTVRALPF